MKSSAPTFWKFGGHAEYMIIHRLQFEMGPSKSTGIEVRKVSHISAPFPIPYAGAERPTGCQRTDRTPRQLYNPAWLRTVSTVKASPTECHIRPIVIQIAQQN